LSVGHLIHALVVNRKIENNNYFTWSNGIRKICSLLGDKSIWEKPNVICKSSLRETILSNLYSVYNEQWLNVIRNKSPKLRTYCKFKTTFSHENYIHILKYNDRSNLCKLRISAHKLMIEAGRYTIPKTPSEKRICQFCILNEIEDEFHFLMRCSFTKNLRSNLISDLNDVIHISSISQNELFNIIIHPSDYDIIKLVGSFVTKASALRFSSTP